MAPKWASFLGLWTIFWAAMSVGTSRLLHTSWWSAWLFGRNRVSSRVVRPTALWPYSPEKALP